MARESRFLSLKDVVKRTGLTPWKIQRLLTYGGLEDVPRVGGKRIFTESDVRRIIVAATPESDRAV